MEIESEAYAGWAVIELMGHRRMGGKIREVSAYGSAMLRIDVFPLEGDTATSTHFYGSTSLYGVHPSSERVARAINDREMPELVTKWDLPENQQRQIGMDIGDEDC